MQQAFGVEIEGEAHCAARAIRPRRRIGDELQHDRPLPGSNDARTARSDAKPRGSSSSAPSRACFPHSRQSLALASTLILELTLKLLALLNWAAGRLAEWQRA